VFYKIVIYKRLVRKLVLQNRIYLEFIADNWNCLYKD